MNIVSKNIGSIKFIFLLVISLGIFISGGVLLWVSSFEVPDLKTFDERKINQSTKIYDRTGEVLLYDIHKDIQRTVIPFDIMSRHIKNATVAIEDAEFYEHRGIKISAIFRAILVNLSAGEYSQGGSTITQQVVKNSLLTTEKTITRKLKEWFLALKLEKVATKKEILELYLNEAPYGGNVYGVEKASNVFFAKSAQSLSLAEAAYLAAIPQAPTFYSPYGNNVHKLEERQNLVLERMLGLGFITQEEYQSSSQEEVVFQPRSTLGIRAPHFVFFVTELLERRYGKDAIENGGLKIITTLDWNLQEKAENIVFEYTKENIEKYNAHNAGLVAVDPQTGHILVMVGSRDYFSKDIDGNFNVTINPNRQPGSAFKPFVYATAFEKGYTPETVVFDLQTQFNVGCDSDGVPLYESVDEEECYTPVNYDEIYRGPITLRDALAQSVNVPAIKTLYLAGLRDSLSTAQKMGVSSLGDPGRYGLTLVLGGGETSLLDMTSAYSVFANDGIKNLTTPLLRVETFDGIVLEEFGKQEERVISQRVARVISNILSDNVARTPAFGNRSYLYFDDADVAAKTGTTNDYRDAWIVGYTPTISAGAWAGNNDNSPMEKRVAGFIIAPLWNAFMKEAIAYLPQKTFKTPSFEDLSFLKPVLRGEWLGGESYYIDTISGKLATEHTPEETRSERFVPNVHSILYWVDKNNPRGAAPEAPEKDSQFALWEGPVRVWVKNHNIQEGGTFSIPTEHDDVHRPEYSPQLTISGLQEAPYNKNERVSIQISSIGKYPLIKADMYINNTYINSAKKGPFMFSFVPKEISILEKTNTITIVGYDAVLNSGKASSQFIVQEI
ncbi:MAG: transglycosylase domain-containing protein [Candidatus Paceibacterota bacterium]